MDVVKIILIFILLWIILIVAIFTLQMLYISNDINLVGELVAYMEQLFTTTFTDIYNQSVIGFNELETATNNTINTMETTINNSLNTIEQESSQNAQSLVDSASSFYNNWEKDIEEALQTVTKWAQSIGKAVTKWGNPTKWKF